MNQKLNAGGSTIFLDAEAGSGFSTSWRASARLPLDFFCSGGATMQLNPVTIGTKPLPSLSGPNSEQVLLHFSPSWSWSSSASCKRQLLSRAPHCIYEGGGRCQVRDPPGIDSVRPWYPPPNSAWGGGAHGRRPQQLPELSLGYSFLKSQSQLFPLSSSVFRFFQLFKNDFFKTRSMVFPPFFVPFP